MNFGGRYESTLFFHEIHTQLHDRIRLCVDCDYHDSVGCCCGVLYVFRLIVLFS